MTLADWGTVADIAQAVVTSFAVVVGAWWAYFKFVKGRTFTPHVEPEVGASWLGADGGLGLQVRVRLKNIGAGQVMLVPVGTGVMISRIADTQDIPPAETRWEDFGVWDVFLDHQWIEPGETIADDLLVRLPMKPETVEVKVRIVLSSDAGNVSVLVRRVFTPSDSVILTKTAAVVPTREQ